MPLYKPVYSRNYLDELKSLSFSNPRLKSMMEKAQKIILENPCAGNVKRVKKLDCFRKHVAAKKYRVFYNINENTKEVGFYSLRLKDKDTYK